MTAVELLQQIIDGNAGEYVRYAPVDLVKACSLLDRIQQEEAVRQNFKGGNIYEALERSAQLLRESPDSIIAEFEEAEFEDSVRLE